MRKLNENALELLDILKKLDNPSVRKIRMAWRNYEYDYKVTENMFKKIFLMYVEEEIIPRALEEILVGDNEKRPVKKILHEAGISPDLGKSVGKYLNAHKDELNIYVTSTPKSRVLCAYHYIS